jgi:pyruvate/2-oxoglutarate dehydrogenase complex dihydrolipoamide dehydrogenase (E3) component
MKRLVKAAVETNRQQGVELARSESIFDGETDRLLAAGYLAPDAEHLLGLAAVAIQHELPIEKLKRAVMTYPTTASNFASTLG